MRFFLGLVADRGTIDPRPIHRAHRLATLSLPFRSPGSRRQTWRAPSGRVALVAWDNAALPDERLLEVDPDGWSATARGGHGYMVETSDMSTIGVDGRTTSLVATTTLTRQSPVYWARADDIWLVSNRALLLARLLWHDDLPRYELSHLVPLIIDGYMRSRWTPYRGVELLGPEETLTIRDGVTRVARDSDPPECGTLAPTDAHREAAMERLRLAVTVPGKAITCALTGGRDSRLVAAALRSTGVAFQAFTRGAPDHPDVVIAQQVAHRLGIPHERQASLQEAVDPSGVMTVDLAARTRQVLFASDGMVSAFENIDLDRGSLGGIQEFGGSGGEALRGGFAKSVATDLRPTWEAATGFLLDRAHRFWRLFVPGALEVYTGEIRTWIATDRALGHTPGASLDRYYTWYRTGRWKAGFTAAGRANPVRHPLLDDAMTRFGLRIAPEAKAEHALVIALTTRLAPELRDVPYAPAVGAPREGASRARTAFDWRRTTASDMFDAFWQRVFEGPGAKQLWQVMDRDRSLRWFQRVRCEGPASARTTWAMWGWYTASMLLSNEWLDPDRGPAHLAQVHVPEAHRGSDAHDGG